jgi:hypothetical protein
MDMLDCFFDISKDTSRLFEGLDISMEKDLCDKWQNKFPVIFLSLKEVDDENFNNAKEKLEICVADLYLAHSYLRNSDKVNPVDVEFYDKICAKQETHAELQNSLYVLMRMMESYYGEQVIVLIDEYDVPLAKANEKGYYPEMLNVIKGIMNKTLKTNRFLKFAVVTGCLRIAKESIFTGINNFVSDTITDKRLGEYFGFTENDVQKLLRDTGFEIYADKIKKWYAGYCFGNIDICCPWDVVNYVNDIQDGTTIQPKNYWENTSHNDILRTFIETANNGMRPEWDVNDEFEKLLAGGCIEKKIEENLTYDTINSSEENLWTLLYLTGYLTQARLPEAYDNKDTHEEKTVLKIPNEEVRDIFKKTVVNWFNDYVVTIDRSKLYEAMWNGDEEKATEIISDLLFDTISYHDYKEDFYHAFVAGIFTGGGYSVKSNREQGYGRTDIVIKDRNHRRIMIIEAKRASDEKYLETECEKALSQIDKMRYADEVKKGYKTVVCYGIAFFDKQCLVKKAD